MHSIADELEDRLVRVNPAERRRAHSVRVMNQRELLQEAGWVGTGSPGWLGYTAAQLPSYAYPAYPSSSTFGHLPISGTGRLRSNSLMGDLRIHKGTLVAM